MGGETFYTMAKGKTAREAFTAARDAALYEHGHGGYTGTIAEKNDFTRIVMLPGQDAEEVARALVEKDDPRISDKWGPAGCIHIEGEHWLFFGWASS